MNALTVAIIFIRMHSSRMPTICSSGGGCLPRVVVVSARGDVYLPGGVCWRVSAQGGGVWQGVAAHQGVLSAQGNVS